ncbi:DUF1893 domain-containing protein [Christensenella intestinihominis]|uniref:DUF1893 domain-containing protein n=1 Tax=Christensenella intestinihominis TaxID=1851429 RepID=UPI0008337AAB|nr:DUF1893 domain-containing protein [Christensenella intestinihominis]
MRDIDRAKGLLKAEGCSCAFVKGGTTYTSWKSGVAPLVEFLSSDMELDGFSAADKIIGKAAALLFVLAGVREVYASVMSEAAIPVLQKSGIAHSCGTLTRTIENRAGTGPCPMEQAVAEIDDPAEALVAIRDTMERLAQQGGKR